MGEDAIEAIQDILIASEKVIQAEIDEDDATIYVLMREGIYPQQIALEVRDA